MIYRSNLEAPDLTPHFRHLRCRPMAHSMGHDVLSDFADRAWTDPVFGLYKKCGFWTHDEAAILYHCALRAKGLWLDIGAHTGWTAAHLAEAGCDVIAVDPMLVVPEFAARFRENTVAWGSIYSPLPQGTSDDYFAGFTGLRIKFSGVVIDGDHDRPWPLRDAQNAVRLLGDTGVILFHDFIGRPVQEGVEFLMENGFQCRTYWTPHMVALCWRGGFDPPVHVRDPKIDWASVCIPTVRGARAASE